MDPRVEGQSMANRYLIISLIQTAANRSNDPKGFMVDLFAAADKMISDVTMHNVDNDEFSGESIRREARASVEGIKNNFGLK